MILWFNERKYVHTKCEKLVCEMRCDEISPHHHHYSTLRHTHVVNDKDIRQKTNKSAHTQTQIF